jgi:hypothetical protein
LRQITRHRGVSSHIVPPLLTGTIGCNSVIMPIRSIADDKVLTPMSCSEFGIVLTSACRGAQDGQNTQRQVGSLLGI